MISQPSSSIDFLCYVELVDKSCSATDSHSFKHVYIRYCTVVTANMMLIEVVLFVQFKFVMDLVSGLWEYFKYRSMMRNMPSICTKFFTRTSVRTVGTVDRILERDTSCDDSVAFETLCHAAIYGIAPTQDISKERFVIDLGETSTVFIERISEFFER
ncbi:Probable ATP-dependent RNA helicase kurz [Galdieria sulphuraria]|nr:Probable ATP-dependent RNA helicase kurz [Galdieria sulphuraria]